MGEYFLPLSAKSESSVLIAEENSLRIEYQDSQGPANLQIETIQGFESVHFVGGGYFKSHGKLPREFIRNHQRRARRFIIWLEEFSLTKAVVLVTMLLAFVIVVRYSIPTISYAVATVIPVSWEKQLGEGAYEVLNNWFFADSEIPVSQQARIREDSRMISKHIEGITEVAILFHKSDRLGANALAFPSGPIVVTDELIQMLNHGEVLAVIAHEFAHIEERHSLQQIVQVAGLSFVAFLVFGIDESVIEEVSSVLIQIWAIGRTREFEKEADLVGLEYLRKAGMDPQNMVTAIEKLTLDSCESVSSDGAKVDCEDEVSSWFSTHPSSSERSQYLKAAIQE